MNFIKIAFSGSQAAQANLTAAAMNTANTLTKGYSRQKALQSSVGAQADNMSVGNGVSVDGFQRISDEYLVKQEWNAISNKSYFDAKTHYLDKLEKTISSNETSLNSGFDKFYNSLSSLSSTPDNMPARIQFIQDAKALTLRFNNVNTEVESQKTMINNQREGIVNEVNMLTKAIANDNQQIEKNIYNGGNVNDLLDKRDEKVRELSKLIEVTTTKDDRGYLNLTLKGGGTLVNGMAASTLETKMNGSNFTGLQLKFANSIFDTDSSCGSQLGGINDYQLVVLQDTQHNVNKIAQQFASEFNNTLNTGNDLAGAAGVALFSFNSANPNKVLQVTSIKPNELALAASGSPIGDNKNVAKLIDTRIKALPGLGNKSINDSYTMLVSEFAVLNRENKIELNDKASTLIFSTQQRESVSGVNMDEEGRSLIEYQNIYQANARVMNMGNKLFADLLALF
ncbi:TPA: flagellar hook-associated protein FlgK [Yersinia enterocolitica]|uniref:flagellar hook-associated protein FlgK n=1 Tax=Yersinia enterocolitica TaxID=630 RepID=UPI001C8E4B34|nr:flagellar hook-associated protein FlgK [Yersinia enterocolitica]EKN4709190.1 flagellar hook-associated protein FlgK [Yersinia enterocolitica]EKN5920856.1 flagellar hook-associated protein FlgK [Yersinia enterocolitica]EKN6147860.1 flagellar hook-associated protein FlgK [Yersinia enterocolitica]MBX9480923.1 flagellar hook-associated protein FlgK [Yersinia enterocolitica]HDL6737037.1 flagellar hook-associated protein FlgK [Yersinia enterocolitica]